MIEKPAVPYGRAFFLLGRQRKNDCSQQGDELIVDGCKMFQIPFKGYSIKA